MSGGNFPTTRHRKMWSGEVAGGLQSYSLPLEGTAVEVPAIASNASWLLFDVAKVHLAQRNEYQGAFKVELF
eukprot:s4804_g4.t1